MVLFIVISMNLTYLLKKAVKLLWSISLKWLVQSTRMLNSTLIEMLNVSTLSLKEDLTFRILILLISTKWLDSMILISKLRPLVSSRKKLKTLMISILIWEVVTWTVIAKMSNLVMKMDMMIWIRLSNIVIMKKKTMVKLKMDWMT